MTCSCKVAVTPSGPCLVIPDAAMNVYATGRASEVLDERGAGCLPCVLVMALDDEFVARYAEALAADKARKPARRRRRKVAA